MISLHSQVSIVNLVSDLLLKMSTHSFKFDTQDISDSEFNSFSQKPSQSLFRTADTDEEYEDESQEVPSSENISPQEFSQVKLESNLVPSPK